MSPFPLVPFPSCLFIEVRIPAQAGAVSFLLWSFPTSPFLPAGSSGCLLYRVLCNRDGSVWCQPDPAWNLCALWWTMECSLCSRRGFNNCSMTVVWGLQCLLSPTLPIWWTGKAMAFKLCLEFGFGLNPPRSSVKPVRNLLCLTSG